VGPQVFIDIERRDIKSRAQQYKDDGWRFVNLCGSLIGSIDEKVGENASTGVVELLYTFSKDDELENLRFNVTPGETVDAISDIYFNALVNENEAHDLYGIDIKGIAIDFGGAFYTVSVPTPMNPLSNIAVRAAADKTYGAANYGACPVPPADAEA
jgi:hypothetical protein